nr:MAG TPA: hypothetical protein [Caudoviricetes sp.]
MLKNVEKRDLNRHRSELNRYSRTLIDLGFRFLM